MLLKKEEFWARLERGQIDPVYLCYGQEEFLIREAIGKIEALFLGPDANKFQYHHLYGDEVTIRELIELASTIPFGKSKRVISYILMGRLKTDERDLITSYADHPCRDTILILAAGEMDFSDSFLKRLEEKTVIVRFYPLFKNQIPDWIRRHAAKIEVQITPSAARLLEELVGSDLTLLSNELQKMALYLQPKKKIDIRDVEEVVGKVRIFSIFELTKGIGEKKTGKSLRILQQLLDAGQSPVGAIGLIANHFRRLYTIKELFIQGKPNTEIARKIGLSPAFMQEYVQQAKLFSAEEIKTIFKRLLDADLQLKSSSLSQDIILESLIFDICAPASSFIIS